MRFLAVIRLAASMPDSSASSCDSCSRACTVAISPTAWICWSLRVTLSVWIRNSLTWVVMPWLYRPSASSGLRARASTALRRVGSCLSPLTRLLTVWAPVEFSVPVVPWEFIAATKAGSAWSVAAVAAWYAARLAAVGWNR